MHKHQTLMAIDLEKIIPLLANVAGKTVLADLVLEYATLKQKLDDSENQTWYFRKAMDSHERRLKNLGKRHERARKFFNQSTIDVLIHRVNQNNQQIHELEKERMGMNRRLMYLSLVAENNRFNELIQLKKRTKTLQSIDYYLDRPEDLLEIIGIG